MAAFSLARPLLFALPPERAHALTLTVLEAGLGLAAPPAPPILATTLAGLALPNPLGLAAGFDKDARVIGPMLRLGFGFVEVGTLTPRAQPGNDGRRVERLVADRALVNRLGFNNGGQAAAVARLATRPPGMVGVNVGANRDSADRAGDYAAGVAVCAPHASYLTLNISSPNTKDLRALQTRAALSDLLARALDPRPPCPVFVKLAPDLAPDELDAIAEAALAHGVSGLVATNTTLARPPLRRAPTIEGGLSGPPLAPLALASLLHLRRLNTGLALIGAGGIASAADAYARIRAGADALQLYTSLVYEGPALAPRITGGLAHLLARDGFSSVAEAVGVDA